MGKKTKTLLDEFCRGYVRAWPFMAIDMQEARLIVAGLQRRQIYVEGRGAETLDALVRATRESQLVGLAGGLRVLGGSHAEIATAAKKIIKAGGILVDIETGERSDRDGISMMSKAIARLRGELTMGDRAEDIGRLGGWARGKSAAEKRMPIEKARKLWFNPKIPNNALAISRMHGWSQTKAREQFGPSGRKPGRPGQKT